MSKRKRRAAYVEWALSRWEAVTGQPVDQKTADTIEIILREHREILAKQVLQIQVQNAYTHRNGVHERDVAAEKLGRTMVVTCANMVAGKFGMSPPQEKLKGRPVEDVIRSL